MEQPALPPGFVPKRQMPALPEGFVMKEPTVAEKAKTMAASVADFFAGEQRKTRATQEFPEVTTGLNLGAFGIPPTAIAKMAAGLQVEMDPQQQINIIRANAEPYGVRIAEQYDEKGNIIINAQKGDQIVRAVLNKPGASLMDAVQLGTAAAAFTPAGRMAGGAGGAISAAVRVGLASAATQGALTGVSDVAGADKSASDYVGEAALAGVAGGGVELLLQGIAKAPALKSAILQRIKGGADESQIKAEISKMGVNIGLDEKGAAQASDEIMRRYAAAAQDAVTPDEALSKALSGEFNIPYTKGQATLNPAQLSLEDTIRVGGKGEKAQGILLAADEKARLAAMKAADDVAATMAGNGRVIGARSEAGALLRDSVKNEAAALDAATSAAYDAAKGTAALKPEGIRPLLVKMRNAVNGVEFDKSLPQTKAVLNEINKFEHFVLRAGKGEGLRLKSFPVERVELMRRRLNTAIGAAADNSDRRQLVLIKNALDSSMDDAVSAALIEGDAAALEAVKQARGLAREYFVKFTSQPIRGKTGMISDPAGQFIEKIVAANPTDTEIVNAMFTASSFNNKAGASMARRFKNIAGAESAEWASVKQAAFRDLLKTNTVNGKEVISGQRTVSAIRDAMKKNPELMREIFNPEEMQKIARFAAAVQRTQPTLIRSAETPSGKHAAMALTDKVREMLPILSGNLGIQLSSMGWTVTKNMRGTGAAKDAIRPFTRAAVVRPELVGAGTAGAMVYGNQ